MLAGTGRGMFDYKAYAKITLKADKKKVKAGKKARVLIKLRDKTTDKRLKKRNIKIYRRLANKKWKLYRTHKTNANGNKVIRVKINKKTRLKAKWVPKKKSAEEYTTSISTVKTIKKK